MKEFIKRLNSEEKNYLKKIKPGFETMATEDLDEWLTNYFQEQGLEDIDNNKEQLMLEKILDILGEL